MPSAAVPATAASSRFLSCARLDVGSAESRGSCIDVYSPRFSCIEFIKTEQDRAEQEAGEKRVAIVGQSCNVAGDEALPSEWIGFESEPYSKVADQVERCRTGEGGCWKSADRHLSRQPAAG